MTTMLWTLIAIQIAMAAFDTIYHHELTERLAWRPSQRHELKLHAARSLIYAVMFACSASLRCMGARDGADRGAGDRGVHHAR